MKDDLETRVRRALGHVAPSSAADADLAGALATAGTAPSGGRRRALGIAVPAAAVLIAVVGVAVLRREPAGGPAPKKIAAAPLDGRTIRAHIDAGGIVVLDDLRGAPRVTVELGGTSARASDGLDVLERALAELAAPTSSDASARSPLALELVPNRKARWRWMQWIMQAAASPKVKIGVTRFGAEGSDEVPIEQRLPEDRAFGTGESLERVSLRIMLMAGLTAGNPTPDGVRVSLGGAGEAWVVDLEAGGGGAALPRGSRVDTPPIPVPMESGVVDLARAMSELRASLRTAVADAGSQVVGVILAPPPGGDAVTYEAVRAVLRAMREAGVEDVQFEGAARPKSQMGTSSR